MKRLSLICVILFIVSNSTFSGGFLTNTNQNILFLRMLARDASTRIDAVYSNPAGLAFIEGGDGLHLSLNMQSAYQTRKITSTFDPFKYGEQNVNSSVKLFKGEASAPVVPSFQVAYKSNDWVFSGSFAVTGGGGKATFNTGLASFESIISMLPVFGNSMGVDINHYDVDSYMEGSQFFYGLQLGVTYRINSYLSAFVGGRMNYVNNNYVGYLRDIKINVPGTENMMLASEVFKGMAAQIPDGAPEELLAKKGLLNAMAEVTQNKELDCEQTGWGVTPIVGLHLDYKKWNIGVKYELNTNLNVQNDTRINTTGFSAYDPGVNTPHDIPALLTIGVSYEFLPTLRASAGFHHFFDKQADMAGGKQKLLSHGTNEYLAGIEWDVHKLVQISGGMQRTKYGLTDDYMDDVSFVTSSYSFGVGAGIKLAKNLNLNVAYFWTNYENYSRDSDDYNQMNSKLQAMGLPASVVSKLPKLSGTDVFTRTNKVFGVGIDYKF